MKISNPTKFFPALNDLDENSRSSYDQLAWDSILMSRGDIIRKFATFDSAIESDWHVGSPLEVDKWIKFSFNGGVTYPLKFQYKNDLIIKIAKDEKYKALDTVEFALSSYSESVYQAVKNGFLSLTSFHNELDSDQNIINVWYSNILNFSYSFNDDTRILTIKLLSDIPSNSDGIMLTIGMDGSNSNALAVSTPLFSSTTGAIPTVYTEEFGICNLLDSKIPAITCLTKFEDVNGLALKVITSDETKIGNVELLFSCGTTSWSQVISVSTTEEWISINVPNQLTGTLVIQRNFNSSNDTLKDDDLVISMCITNIKMERI